MATSVTKAVIPAAGLGTRFLPVTKSQPKEMLPVVDKPSIQYVVEEAVAAGLHRHPHHHRAREARHRRPLRPQLRARALPRAVGEARPARRRPGRQRHRRHPLHPPARSTRSRPRGERRARARRRRAVRGAPRRRHHGRRRAAARARCSTCTSASTHRCLALLEVTPAEIASLGCAEVDIVERVARTGAVDRREAEAGRGAVEPRGDRSLRVHAVDLRRARSYRAGRERRVPAHRRDRAAARLGTGVRPQSSPKAATTSARSRDSSRPTSSSRSTATTSDPTSREYLVELVRTRGLCVIPLDEVRAGILAAIDRLEPVEAAVDRRARARARGRRRCPPARSLRSPTRRWTGTRCVPRAPPAPAPTRRFASAWSGSCPRVTRPRFRSATGEAIRIMTGAPMPDGADAIVMVELTEREGVDGVLVHQEAKQGRPRAPGGWRRRARRGRVPCRHRAGPGAPRRAREHRRRPGAGRTAAPVWACSPPATSSWSRVR